MINVTTLKVVAILYCAVPSLLYYVTMAWSIVPCLVTIKVTDCTVSLWLITDCTLCRPVVPGGAGGPGFAIDYCRSVNPISTREGRLCPHITIGIPGFSDLPTALLCISKSAYSSKSKSVCSLYYVLKVFCKKYIFSNC